MMKKIIPGFVVAFMFVPAGANAADCAVGDRPCVLEMLKAEAAHIGNGMWRDQAYRELAKTLAFDGHPDEAIGLIEKIQSPDTQALTIRGIGMATADRNLPKESYDPVFMKLRAASEKIADPPSYAIALTYIAMGQAFAGDNDGAWATAASMENESLRHKAYGETAEIQAERSDYAATAKSIGFIESASYKNKAWANVSKILADGKRLDDAFAAANAITTPYEKATALQYILDIQKPREIPHQ